MLTSKCRFIGSRVAITQNRRVKTNGRSNICYTDSFSFYLDSLIRKHRRCLDCWARLSIVFIVLLYHGGLLESK